MATSEGTKGMEWKCASWKKEQDFTTEINALLEDIDRCATATNGPEICQRLLDAEKMTRLAGDVENTRRVAVKLISLFQMWGNVSNLLDHLQLLLRRRAQSPIVQTAIVQEAIQLLTTKMESHLTREELMNTLLRMKALTEGKLHVELEYGRTSVRLAKIYEEDGKIDEACVLLQDIQVETMTSLPKKEKMEILVHHIDLCLRLSDYTRAAIMSRKIGSKAIASDDCKALRREYFHFMNAYYTHMKNYHCMAMCCWELYDCTEKQPDVKFLQQTVVYLLISPPQSQKDILESIECTAFHAKTIHETDRIAWLKKLLPEIKLKLEKLYPLVQALIDAEWIHIEPFLRGYDAYLVQEGYPVVCMDALRQRFIEHNIIMLSKYYSRAPISKLAQLISDTEDVVERVIMELVALSRIYAKINRVDGIVSFRCPLQAHEEIEEWAHGVENVMGLINSTCHLIAKERMLCKV